MGATQPADFVLMNLLDELRGDVMGLSLLKDWLGEGGVPVSKAMAESRASVCLGCELNQAPRWWEKTKGLIADTMRRQLELRNKLNLLNPDVFQLAYDQVFLEI